MLRCWQRVTKTDAPLCPFACFQVCVDEFDSRHQIFQCKVLGRNSGDVYSALKTSSLEGAFFLRVYSYIRELVLAGDDQKAFLSFPHSLNKSFKNTMPGWAPKV